MKSPFGRLLPTHLAVGLFGTVSLICFAVSMLLCLFLLSAGVSYVGLCGAMIVNSVLLFGVAGVISRRFIVGNIHTKPLQYGNLSMALSIIILTLVCQPLIEWAAYFNEWICKWEVVSVLFGGDLSDDEWAARILCFDSPLKWFVAIFVVAFLPALCEEIYFRGAMLPLLRRMCGNWHLAIVITALVFSLIHFDCNGFLPRSILGGIMGLLVLMTRRLWTSIFFHFCHNAFIVISMGLSDQDVSELMSAPAEHPGIFIALLSVGLVFVELHVIGVYSGFFKMPVLPDRKKSGGE